MMPKMLPAILPGTLPRIVQPALRALPWLLLSWACHAGTVDWPTDMPCGAEQSPAVQQQTLATAQGPIGYFRFGHGTPIVLITGYRATMANWNTAFLNALAASHEVIVFENRGVGASQPDTYDTYDTRETPLDRSAARTAPAAPVAARDPMQAFARDAAALIGQLGLRDVTVLGWSMGGAIAQELAVQAPTLVRRLVLMNTLPPGPAGEAVSPDVMKALSGNGPDHFRQVMTVLFPDALVADAMRCFVKDMFRPAGYTPPLIPPAASDRQERALAAWMHDEAALTALRKVTIPALILSGSADVVLSPLNGAALEQTLSNSRWIEVSGGGHAMMYQYPRELAREIDAFMAR